MFSKVKLRRHKTLVKKWVYCWWAHKDYRCFPEVWGRGLEGPWHCDKCRPCWWDFEEALDKILWNKDGD